MYLVLRLNNEHVHHSSLPPPRLPRHVFFFYLHSSTTFPLALPPSAAVGLKFGGLQITEKPADESVTVSGLPSQATTVDSASFRSPRSEPRLSVLGLLGKAAH